jgi:hypothetical protein
VNRDDAAKVLTYLSAAFPRQEWPDNAARVWKQQLEPVGLGEAMAAAEAVARNHEFLSLAAFFRELAVVRERALDEQRSARIRPALTEGSLTADGDAREHIAEIRAALAILERRDRAILADPLPRYDEDYFAARPDLLALGTTNQRKKGKRKRRRLGRRDDTDREEA